MSVKTIVNQGKLSDTSPCIRAVYYKTGLVDIIFRTGGLIRPGVIEIYETDTY
jgi:hypothetical protein